MAIDQPKLPSNTARNRQYLKITVFYAERCFLKPSNLKFQQRRPKLVATDPSSQYVDQSVTDADVTGNEKGKLLPGVGRLAHWSRWQPFCTSHTIRVCGRGHGPSLFCSTHAG